MSLLIAAVLATTPAPTPACSWNRPGHRAFTGDVVAAVDRYQDIPAPVRARLKQRMATRQYDEIVTIGRDTISGRYRYSAQIRDMHFGDGQVCRTVDRSAWSSSAQERGLVYCEDGHCILVPTVCRNVSRVHREGPLVAGAGGAAGGLPGEPGRGGDSGAAAPGAPGSSDEAGPTVLPAVAGVRAEADLGEVGAPPGGLSGNGDSAGSGAGSAGPSFAEASQPGGGRLPGSVTGPDGNPAGTGSAGSGPDSVPLGNLSGSDRLPTGGGGLAPSLPNPAPPLPVPEPASALLMLGGLAALLLRRGRRAGGHGA